MLSQQFRRAQSSNISTGASSQAQGLFAVPLHFIISQTDMASLSFTVLTMTSPFSYSPLLGCLPRTPANMRMVRTVTCATLSQPSSGKPLRGIMKPRRVSPEMQELVGVPEISRTQALKQIWAHIKDNNLQDPENKKIIICDEKLKKIFGGKDQVGFLEISGLITPHFLK